MEYFKKNLKFILDYLFSTESSIIDVKKIRRKTHIKAQNRSTINFLWRGLQTLAEFEYLEIYKNGSKNKQYTITEKLKTIINLPPKIESHKLEKIDRIVSCIINQKNKEKLLLN